jgi:hypothetical protein
VALLGYRKASDRKFATAKVPVPQCLNMCETLTIHQFFCKTWCYMDTYWWASCVHFSNSMLNVCYSKGLDAHQTAFAVHKYKSHHHVGLPSEIIALMQA